MEAKEMPETISPTIRLADPFLGNVVGVCIVTHDHRRVMTRLVQLGIGPWRVYTFSPENTSNQTYKGQLSAFSLTVCFAPLGTITYAIIQPLSGPNIFSDFLHDHDEGVHHVTYDCNNIPFPDRLAELAKRGFGLPSQSGSWMGKNHFAFFNTEATTTTCLETISFPEVWEFPEPDFWFPEPPYPLSTPSPLMTPSQIPAGQASTVFVARGRVLKITNTHGSQVIDTWALNPSQFAEHLSMSHTTAVLKTAPSVGDTLFSNRRNAMLTIIADSSPPGTHDTLIAACDAHRYRQLGADGHLNCSDNFQTSLRAVGIAASSIPPTPDPWNLFMNNPRQDDSLTPGKELLLEAPHGKKGAYIELRAEMDLWVVMSSCPQDMLPGMVPKDAAFEVL
ncbi:hypothetical protein MMC07_007758 [Pseudocyphellaria aurata]|nr:hypothetical protein [Pseudocyphellaria aurata]